MTDPDKRPTPTAAGGVPESAAPEASATAADAHLREDMLHSEQVFKGHLLDVRRDRIRLPDGGEAHREYIVHPGAVVVIPILDDGRLVLVRQYRYPLGRVMLEFPAGKLEVGEPPYTCAVRELAEETGYRAAEWARAGELHNAIAYSSEGIDIWLARGLTLGEQALDEGEFVDVAVLSLDELLDQARRGELTDAKTLIGLLWLQNLRTGYWDLGWQPAG